MKKFILTIAILLGILTGGVVTHPEISRSVALVVQTKPTQLTIPALNIQTTIELVGKDKEGAMDVPKNTDDVGWYKYGPIPGEKGSAVIDGHLDTKTGPAIFARLSDLQPGDEVQVTDGQGKTKTFIVEKTAIYDNDSFPLQDVFGQSDQARLNLITCTGVFNHQAKEYNKRYVVYTVLKS